MSDFKVAHSSGSLPLSRVHSLSFFDEFNKQRADLHSERAFAKKKMANNHHTDGND